MLDSQGFILMMTPAQALKSIQVMADHSHNWYNGATTWQRSSHNSDDTAVITNRVDSLGCDIQQLRESIHAIQVGFLEETVNKLMEESIKRQAAIDEWIRKYKENIELNLKKLDAVTKNLQVKADQLTQAILTNHMVDKVETKMRKELVPFDLPIVN
ncbi:hypothetical protein Tco_1390375 [Tanacetum coccineum]